MSPSAAVAVAVAVARRSCLPLGRVDQQTSTREPANHGARSRQCQACALGTPYATQLRARPCIQTDTTTDDRRALCDAPHAYTYTPTGVPYTAHLRLAHRCAALTCSPLNPASSRYRHGSRPPFTPPRIIPDSYVPTPPDSGVLCCSGTLPAWATLFDKADAKVMCPSPQARPQAHVRLQQVSGTPGSAASPRPSSSHQPIWQSPAARAHCSTQATLLSPRAHCDLTRRNCSSRPCHVVSRNAPLPRRPASCKASNFFLAHRGPSRDAGRAAPPRPRSFTASLHNFGVAARPWLALWLPRVKGIHSLGDQTVLHYSMETSSLARKVQSRGLSMACTLRLGVPCSSSSHNCFRLAPRDAGMASAFKPWAKVAPASGNPDAGAACPCPACPARPSLATRSPTRSPGALPLSNGSSSCSECLVSVGHRSRAFALRHA